MEKSLTPIVAEQETEFYVFPSCLVLLFLWGLDLVVSGHLMSQLNTQATAPVMPIFQLRHGKPQIEVVCDDIPAREWEKKTVFLNKILLNQKTI